MTTTPAHHHDPSTDTAIGHWLAASLREPQTALHGWRADPITMLPTGRLFDAVRIPGKLVHAAIGATDHAPVSAGLEKTLAGPVISDSRWYYALVPPHTSETWTSGLAQCLGQGAWLTVPRPDHTQDTGTRVHWCTPMTNPGRLCDPPAVAALIDHGHKALTTPTRRHQQSATTPEGNS
ncbi:hypothetical protein [Streptomyces sp. NPDC020141]|uniref:hypothetical protein n=1 Tax=Streptomyces sp. NPDC020141 TaxID=3365065 RepID=UPI00378D4B80